MDIAANHSDVTGWLLEPGDIGVRYLALRDLVGATVEEVAQARQQAHAHGPIAQVLAQMHPEGYWEKPGPGYGPKYRGTVWSIILLAQLGASCQTDARVERACSYLLDNALTGGGQFSASGSPSGTADCLQGNLCASLLDMGCEDPRLDRAFEWMARSVTGEGVAPMGDKAAAVRYYAGKCGPFFACGANNKLPCAWGATKVMLAFSKLPDDSRTPLIRRAIEAGVGFLLGTDPVTADYPCGYSSKPSGNWWRFGFPVFYVTDILQIAEALTGLGYGKDARLMNAINLIRDKQDSHRRWQLEYDYRRKTWVDFGPKKHPNKWVTLRALRVLQRSAQR
jgi:hypothetical protein